MRSLDGLSSCSATRAAPVAAGLEMGGAGACDARVLPVSPRAAPAGFDPGLDDRPSIHRVAPNAARISPVSVPARLRGEAARRAAPASLATSDAFGSPRRGAGRLPRRGAGRLPRRGAGRLPRRGAGSSPQRGAERLSRGSASGLFLRGADGTLRRGVDGPFHGVADWSSRGADDPSRKSPSSMDASAAARFVRPASAVAPSGSARP